MFWKIASNFVNKIAKASQIYYSLSLEPLWTDVMDKF